MTDEELLDDLEQYALGFPSHYNLLVPQPDLLRIIRLARQPKEPTDA